ncbi:hypothetical protein QQS21_004304 [Conoideocrella luteorostrata]|uniref:Altered inheritance of mitochondria protein 21 n=1 Tax=Conoideocrella luteorostrata TaxID=1105319 RepID=A0AAJ0FVL9_9HYPO|nr:hypothetical protein QQS21_004304 [Conoideocrella luteorostrata]
MSAAPMAQTPVVPPRPSRSSDKDASGGLMPQVPPRPVNKHLDRSVSPARDRFAQSPLMQGIPHEGVDNGLSKRHAQKQRSNDPIERSRSVDMPSVGEEGMEYGAVASELAHDERRPSAPEQTRLVDESLKLHAPKPSLPASSAKQQVMAVTRTDSDRAASFGIGQPSNGEERAISRGSMRKRPESSYSAHSDQGNHTDEDHGIPEIGQRVPMNKHLGDVQAPSPGPGAETPKKHHARKLSARSLPPGSYGLHGHGVAPQDKLEKAYYQKHPEALQREKHTPHHERQNDFAMSSSDLNRLVRDTPSRQALTGSAELRGTPTDDVAFEATEKYTSRISSSRPSSIAAPKDSAASGTYQRGPSEDDQGIHVDDGKNPEFYSYGDDKDHVEAEDYIAPILASDEVGKDPNPRMHKPAIRPHLERRGSSYDAEDTPSRPASRPRNQHHPSQQQDHKHTHLEDVEEYDPLFPEEGKEAKVTIQEPAEEVCERNHFPSKDIWEDAPNSVHFTAEVSTPDVPEPERRRSSAYYADRPITPAQAFALYQEQLAEKEANGRTNTFLPLQDSKPSWIGHQPHLQSERPTSSSSKRFPSRDIWEDAPESYYHEAEVSASPVEQSKPEIPARPAKKASLSPERPVVPGRPAARQNSGDDDAKQRPPISDRPKPSIPPRPTKSSSGDSKDDGVSKTKPPVPSRPAGGKIAALQAGFMSDLNKRLQLGPQGVKKDEPKEEELVEEKEKAPLSDARKGRARGPQRRAPAKSPVGAASSEIAKTTPVLSFSMPQTVWSVEPEHGDFAFADRQDHISEDDLKPVEPASTPKLTESAAAKQVEPAEDLQPAASEPVSGTVPVARKPAVAPDELVKTSESKEDVKHDPAPHAVEDLTLAANTAGESILETTVKKSDNEVDPVEIHEDVKA